MTKQEFIERTKLQVTDEQFEEINGIYNAIPNIFKDEFCDLYMNDKDKLIKRMARAIDSLYWEIMTHMKANETLKSKIDKYATILIDFSLNLNNESLYGMATDILGVSGIIRYKVDTNKELNEKEKMYLYELLDKQ